MADTGTQILLAEDSPADVRLFKEAVKRWKTSAVCLYIARDGQEAIDFLKCREDVKPDLILLNINLPKLSGFDVLRWIRRQPKFRHIPAIMLSSSNAPGDVTMARQYGATSYITKASDFDEYCNRLGEVETYCNKTG